LPRSIIKGAVEQFEGAAPVLLAMIVFLTEIGPIACTAPTTAEEFDATVTLVRVSSVPVTGAR